MFYLKMIKLIIFVNQDYFIQWSKNEEKQINNPSKVPF